MIRIFRFYVVRKTNQRWDENRPHRFAEIIAMFNYCKNIKSLDLSNFDTSSVKTMQSMFQSCTNLESLNISSFNTENVYNMSYMFYGCKALTDIDFTNFSMKSVVSSDVQMFYLVPRKTQNKFKREHI